MKAAGVPKKFSTEEIERRKARLAIAREALLADRRRQKAESERRREEHRRLVKTMAELGVFVPVQDFE